MKQYTIIVLGEHGMYIAESLEKIILMQVP